MGCHFLLQGIFPTEGSNHVSCVSCFGRWIFFLIAYATWKSHDHNISTKSGNNHWPPLRFWQLCQLHASLGIQFKITLTCSCNTSLIFFTRAQFLSLSWLSWPRYFLKTTGQLFYKMSLNFGFPDVFLYILVRISQKDGVFFSLHPIRWYVILISLYCW